MHLYTPDIEAAAHQSCFPILRTQMIFFIIIWFDYLRTQMIILPQEKNIQASPQNLYSKPHLNE